MLTNIVYHWNIGVNKTRKLTTNRCDFKINMPYSFASCWNESVTKTVFQWTSNAWLNTHSDILSNI